MKIKYEKLVKAILAGMEYGLADIEPFQMLGWLVEDGMKKRSTGGRMRSWQGSASRPRVLLLRQAVTVGKAALRRRRRRPTRRARS